MTIYGHYGRCMKFAKAATHFEFIVIYKMKLGLLQGLHLKKGVMIQVKRWNTDETPKFLCINIFQIYITRGHSTLV